MPTVTEKLKKLLKKKTRGKKKKKMKMKPWTLMTWQWNGEIHIKL